MTKLSLTVKPDNAISGTRDVNSQGQLKAVQERMGKKTHFSTSYFFCWNKRSSGLRKVRRDRENGLFFPLLPFTELACELLAQREKKGEGIIPSMCGGMSRVG